MEKCKYNKNGICKAMDSYGKPYNDQCFVANSRQTDCNLYTPNEENDFITCLFDKIADSNSGFSDREVEDFLKIIKKTCAECGIDWDYRQENGNKEVKQMGEQHDWEPGDLGDLD